MTDAEKNGAEAGIPPADATFLITCLQNAVSGAIAIDAAAVGNVLGYTNSKSVSNRISTLKKKYNLPFGSGATKGAAAASSPEGKVPATPSKNRVSKPRTASAKKAAAPKTPKVAKGKGKSKVEKTDEAAEADDANGVESDDELSDVGESQAGQDADDGEEPAAL